MSENQEVRKRKVTVMIRVKVDGEWIRKPALYREGKGGKIRAGCVMIDGKEKAYGVDECNYELRYYEGGAKHFEAVGKNATEANAQRVIRINQTHAREEAKKSGLSVEEEKLRVTLKGSAAEYIEDCDLRDATRASYDAGMVTAEFMEVTGLKYGDEVTRKSILVYRKSLRDQDLKPRTVKNKDGRVRLWLKKFAGVKEEIFPAILKCGKKLPTVYTSARLRGLFAVADPYEKVAFELLLKLGLRAREGCHAEFSDISFEGKFFRVQNKPKYNFEIKDHEERDIPIPDDFLATLWAWKELHPGQSLIVPGEDGGPLDRFVLLQMLKAVANRAGLACGKCGPCHRGRHIVKPCAEFTLHRFRRTFVTGLLLSGVDVATVQAYAGHADLVTTMLYLRALSARAGQPAVSAIDWESEDFVIGL